MSKLLEQINESRITKRLGDLVLINQSSITNGFSYKEIEYIDTSAVTKNHFENPQILNINEAPSRAKRLLKDGDTILSTVRPNLCHYGFIKDPKPNTVASTGFVVLTPKNINPFYLYSYLTQDSITDTLSSIAEATTTTFPAFRPEVLSEMEIEIPDLPIQNKIAEILSAYDVKIENNNKITKNLEATAQTIFNEWFINLRFPGYEKVKMVDSEVGEIPAGWSVGKIKDFIRVESGFPFSSSVFNDQGKYKLVTIRNVQDGSFVTDCDNLIDELPSKLPEHCLLRSGDILLSLTGNVGRICLVNGENYVLNQRVSVLVPVDERDRAYTYFLFRRNDFQNLLISISKGTAQLNLSPVETKELEAIIPNDITLEKYSEIATPIYKKIVEINSENVKLKETRDQLLAKLI